MYLTLLLALIYLNNQFPSVATTHGMCNKVCTCFTSPGRIKSNVTCPGVEVISINYGKTNVQIRCQQPHPDQLSVFTDLKINATRYFVVEMNGCSLPNSSLSNLLASINVRGFVVLHINSYRGSFLRKHFENLDKVLEFNVAQSDIGVLSVDVFDGLRNLNKIRIECSSFKLTKGIFSYTPNLKSVKFDRNSILEVSFDDFNNLTRLERLEIIGANNTSVIFANSTQYILPFLSYLMFISIRLSTHRHVLGIALDESKPSSMENITDTLAKHLREIILQNTKTFTLELHDNFAYDFHLQPSCFADLFNLETVELSGNHLNLVPEEAFSKSTNILEINLKNNSINSFESNTFSNLKKLERLFVSNNQISHLPEGLFSKTKSLKLLYIDHNLLKQIEP